MASDDALLKLIVQVQNQRQAKELREEFARLEGTRWEETDGQDAFFRIKGARDLTRRELAVLRELVPWRDSVAQAMDRATFRVIGNEQLLEIARVHPKSRDDLAREDRL